MTSHRSSTVTSSGSLSASVSAIRARIAGSVPAASTRPARGLACEQTPTRGFATRGEPQQPAVGSKPGAVARGRSLPWVGWFACYDMEGLPRAELDARISFETRQPDELAWVRPLLLAFSLTRIQDCVA